MTSRLELIELLAASQDGVPEAALAAQHLRAVSIEEIPRSRIATSELLRIHSRRLRKVPTDVRGLEGLVVGLRESNTEVVDLYVVAEGGTVTSVVLSPSGAFVGCVVGPDRS